MADLDEAAKAISRQTGLSVSAVNELLQKGWEYEATQGQPTVWRQVF